MRPELQSFRCLIVEDQAFQREIIAQILKQLHVGTILTAADGQEAVHILQEGLARDLLPDVIICDLNMPNIDGIELLRYLNYNKIPSGLILTSGTDIRLLQTAAGIAQEHGLHLLGQLEKPVLAKHLEALLLKMFDKPDETCPTTHSFSAGELNQGLRDKEFEPYFQPIVSLETGDVVSVEALARWNHAEHGVIGPVHFISLMEEFGLASEITDHILRSSLQACSQWQRMGWDIGVAVNFSVMALEDLKFPDKVFSLASSLGVAASALTIELTESRGVANLVRALDILSRLRMKGFELSIDDFGTGNATIEQLLRVPFTELKLDRLYVSNAWDNGETRVVLESVVQMAKNLGLKVVAEGVETQKDYELVKALRCDEGQGFYFARPMQFEQLLAWLENRR
ncbi:MAG: EAL domain-containing response regulator [Negativicutes bacterium]|nr:EAL domain-containing response regulator [Negativicutes bacterium]